MLSRLSIRDIVLIDRLDIDFADGLAVLTGETGAGKSILLDAFALALGARGDQALVRQGAEQGQVIASFEVARKHPARAVLKANDIAADDELILRRMQFSDGRTRAFVNDQPVSVQVLKQLGEALVEIHGQHDDRALTDAATHRRLLDAFGALEDDAGKVEALWEARRAAQAAADAHRAEVARARREGDYLHHAVEELEKLAPTAGEETALADRRALMMQAEKVAEDLREAHDAIAGANSSVPAFAGVIRRLERRVGAGAATHRAGGEVARCRAHRAGGNPRASRGSAARRRLRSGRARAHRGAAVRAARRGPQIQRAGRRPGGACRALQGRCRADRRRRGEAQGAGGRRHARPTPIIRAAADALSKARLKAATALDKAVNAELKPLKLERAKFSTEIVSDEAAAGPNGIDRVEFWVQTNPGTRPGPLMKVASGGELARFLLALKVVLADRGSAPTLVFDEIDTGVGGAVADAIGVRLARLASGVQVLAVTHAPQVAARADRHYLISKDALDKGKRVATRVTEVAKERRREEIARMLAGAEITNEARAAAERLIKAASRSQGGGQLSFVIPGRGRRPRARNPYSAVQRVIDRI